MLNYEVSKKDEANSLANEVDRNELYPYHIGVMFIWEVEPMWVFIKNVSFCRYAVGSMLLHYGFCLLDWLLNKQ